MKKIAVISNSEKDFKTFLRRAEITKDNLKFWHMVKDENDVYGMEFSAVLFTNESHNNKKYFTLHNNVLLRII